MINDSLYSSRSDNWATPQPLFDTLNRIFAFKLDVCADAENKKCSTYYSVREDGLQQDWSTHKTVWMNPPYGRTIGQWMEKAYKESLKGCVVVCLVPARTDKKWWH